MKPIFYIFIIIINFTLSCKKKNPETNKDEIIYTEISPNKEIKTVRYFTFEDHSICTSKTPTPTDSSDYYDIDLDKDNEADFRITVSHSKYTSGYCGHCDRFTYSISIEGLSINDSIVKSSSSFWIPKIHKNLETIEFKNNWISRGNLVLLEGCSLPFNTDFDKGFIGVKIKNSLGYIQIGRLTNNGIRIIDFGFNKTENNSIICSQKK
jgi:hypothetical protein